MRHFTLSTGLVALTLIFAAEPAQGNTIDIRVLSATFTSTVTVAANPNPATKETKTSKGAAPVSESLHRAYCDDLTNVVVCESGPGAASYANADAAAALLDVSAVGSAYWYTDAIAYADSEWTFSPVWDGTAVINIFGVSSFIESTQHASLFDVTANEQVWLFSTDRALGMSEVVPTSLYADHVYAMHLTAFAAGRGDYTLSNVQVSGIRAVPDNVDTFVCFCMGLLAALLGNYKLRT